MVSFDFDFLSSILVYGLIILVVIMKLNLAIKLNNTDAFHTTLMLRSNFVGQAN